MRSSDENPLHLEVAAISHRERLVRGMLPLLATAFVAWTGNIYAGLYYPIAVTLMTVIVGTLFLSETKDRDITR